MPQLRLLPLLLSILLVSFAPAAWASVVAVSPVRIHLSGAKRSEQLNLKNNSDKPARYQITAHAWHETPDGEMQLVPTQDLLFFPSLVAIAPGQTRRVRLASTVPAGSSENTYRILIEELPGPSGGTGVIQVLTRVNVPVFVQPAAPRPKPLVTTRVESGHVRILVQNTGNAYFKTTSLRVVARSQAGTVLFDKSLPGWYVLAFGSRRYSLQVPPGACAELASVTTTATTEHGKTRAVTRIAPNAACAR